MNEALMPVLIGCGQMTDKRPPGEAGTPVELMAEVARKAADDAGPGQVLLDEIAYVGGDISDILLWNTKPSGKSCSILCC